MSSTYESSDYSSKAPGVHMFHNAKEFQNEKIKMLRDEFCIRLTSEDERYIRSFKTENEINASVRTIINKYWK